MGRHGPGPVYVGDAGDHWWIALFGRKNKSSKSKPQTRRENKPRGRSKTGVRKDKKGKK